MILNVFCSAKIAWKIVEKFKGAAFSLVLCNAGEETADEGWSVEVNVDKRAPARRVNRGK